MKEITRLTQEVRDHYNQAAFNARKAKEQCGNAIQEAILCGQALLKAKSLLSHGEWLPWLKEEFGIQQNGTGGKYSERTLQKFMKLAKNAPIALNGSDLNPPPKTIVEAYRATGVLPQLPPKIAANRPIKSPFNRTLKTLQGLRAKLESSSFSLSDDERLAIQNEASLIFKTAALPASNPSGQC